MRNKTRILARAAVRWLLVGILFIILSPLFAYYGLMLSGRLVLTQTIPASEAVRGFDFGPVYLQQGVTGRYYISALLPQTEGDYWHTSFEVLNDQRTPVYRQDELRFIGDYQFTPGERDSYRKAFSIDKATGYYYFRFTALNGVYETNQLDPPVVELSIRQGVLSGWALWLPVAMSLLLGVCLVARAVVLVRRLGASDPDLAAIGDDPAGGSKQRKPRSGTQRNVRTTVR